MSRKSIPEGLSYIPGAKVSWRVYATEGEANAAAEIAKHNARIDAAEGYDFGFMTPGEISPHKTYDGRDLFKVCFS